MLGFELAHVGMNSQDADGSKAAAEELEELFGLGLKCGNGSYFVGEGIEATKKT